MEITKTENLKLFCTKILNDRTPEIRTVASLSGKITSIFPAAKFVRLNPTLGCGKKMWTICITLLLSPTLIKFVTTDASSYRLGAVMEFQSTGSLLSTSEM